MPPERIAQGRHVMGTDPKLLGIWRMWDEMLMFSALWHALAPLCPKVTAAVEEMFRQGMAATKVAVARICPEQKPCAS